MAGESSEQDLAYIAGFFDGEGCVSIRRARPVRPNQNTRYSLLVTIANTNLPILEFIAGVLGGVIHRCSWTTLRRRAMYHLYWCGYDARKVLETIQPFLRIKKQEAELGISFQNVMDTSAGGNKYYKVSQLEIDVREVFYQAAKKLKQPADMAGKGE